MKRQQHAVVVPVKSPAIGKSRLRVPDHARPRLATAFALDVLDAVKRVGTVAGVVVMTADEDFAATSRAAGVRTVPDGDGLNHGLELAAARMRSWWPDAVPVALCADLPCLVPQDLADGLAEVVDDGPWFCADAEDTGTTLYCAAYDRFAPRFGARSRAAHESAGARPVLGQLTTLRLDVDDELALADAVRLGTGPHTRAALTALVP